jgi:hypothetical protein
MLKILWTNPLSTPTVAGEAPAKVLEIENPAAPLRFCDHTSLRGQLKDSSGANTNVQTDAPNVPASHFKPGRFEQGEKPLLDIYLERTDGSEQEAAATGSAVIEQEAAAADSAGFEQEAAVAEQQASVAEQETASIE